jgi:hypothetical protein
MAGIKVSFEVLNQLNTPTLYADTLVNRPVPAIVGRIFFRTDSPYGIYRDTGTAWDLVASPDTTGISGTLAAGQVPYATGTSTVAGTNNFFWDAVNSRLGIKTTTPGVELDIHGTGTVAHFNGTGTSNAFVNFQSAGVNEWRIGNNYSGGTNYFSIFDQTNSGEIVKIEAGNTALNGINTINAASFNNYTLTGIAAATTINNNRFITNYTFDSGITRTTIAEIGTRIESNNTFSGSFTKSNDGQQSALFTNLVFNLSGNFTQNQPATYTQTPTSTQSGATFTGAFSVSHFSNTRLAPWISATPSTITNAYQLVINNLSAFSVSSLSPTYTNRWGIYQDGSSDNNYFAGKLLIGTTTVGTTSLSVNGTSFFSGNIALGSTSTIARSNISNRINITGGTTAIAYEYEGNILSDVTADARGYSTYIATSGTFSLNILRHFFANAPSTFSATITNQYGFMADSGLIGATNNYGFFGGIAAGTNRWNIYMNGTANNYMAGVLTIGTTSPNASAKVQIDTTTQGFLPPRMTTTQKNAIGTPAAGLVIFDTTLAKLCVYSGSAWQTITSV